LKAKGENRASETHAVCSVISELFREGPRALQRIDIRTLTVLEGLLAIGTEWVSAEIAERSDIGAKPPRDHRA